MKPWVKKGAICECYGEGRGNLFVIETIRGQLVWLKDLDRPGYHLGWKSLTGCYRSDKARRAERAVRRGRA